LNEQEEAALGKQYDVLKAYLMISGEYKGNAEASHIASTFKEYWTAEAKIPADLNSTAQSQLDFWAKQLTATTRIFVSRASTQTPSSSPTPDANCRRFRRSGVITSVR
jgi:type VI protein secretion system component VasK